MPRARTTQRRALGLWAAVTIGLCLHSPVSGQRETQTDPEAVRSRLTAIQSELATREAARASLTEAEKAAESDAKALSENLVTVGLRVRAAEVDAERLESQISLLEAQAQETSDTLDQRRSELTELVSSLTTLSRRPAAMALLQPGEAVETARSAALLARLVPEIEDRALELSEDLQALAAIRRNLSNERYALKNTLQRLARNQEDLQRLLSARRKEAEKARAGLARETALVERLAQEADSLRDLIKDLEAAAAREAARARERGQAWRSDPPPGFGDRQFARSKGSIAFPLSGDVIKKYGERDGSVTARGLTIRGRAGAQAVAPFDGQVVFAGPYRGYGRLVILAHDGGYHSLLAGLNRLYGEAGQWVLAGEPIGSVPDLGPEAGQLYLELRADGSPIDPTPWLAKP